MKQTKIILASGSPRRKELLEQMDLDFVIRVSDCDEQIDETAPEQVVHELSRRKAEAVEAVVKAEMPGEDTLIIGADTIVAKEDHIFGKPRTHDEAFAMIEDLQGGWHSVFTGVTVICMDASGGRAEETFVEETKVHVIPMREEEIRTYIETKEPYDKAGGYAIQGRFGRFIDRIEGDYANVVGLPICHLYQVVTQFLGEDEENVVY